MSVPGSGKATFRGPPALKITARPGRPTTCQLSFSRRKDWLHDEVVGLGRSEFHLPDGRQTAAVALDSEETRRCEYLAHGPARRSCVDSDARDAGQRGPGSRVTAHTEAGAD